MWTGGNDTDMTYQARISQDSLDKLMESLRKLVVAMEGLAQSLSRAFSEIAQRAAQVMLPSATDVDTHEDYPGVKMVADSKLPLFDMQIVPTKWKQSSTHFQDRKTAKLPQQQAPRRISRQETGFRKRIVV